MTGRLTILHTNDIHGRVEALARIATLVERERAASAHPVLYLDGGDSEDHVSRLSNLTKGIGIHRLLRVAGCDAAAVGNATVIRYGIDPLPEQAAAGGYPHLAANLFHGGSLVPGVQPRALLERGGLRVGLIGLTPTSFRETYERFFGLELPDAVPIVREHAAALRAEGADVVVLLSHLGYDEDRRLAPEFARDVDVLIGAHSHTLLPEGEVVDALVLAQAGMYGEYLGRVEVALGERVEVASVRVEAVLDSTPPHPAVLAELEAAERELEEFLAEVVGELPEPLDLADDRECGVVAFTADVLRRRMGAEIGLATPYASFVAPLPAGPLRRGVLWESCPSTGNPGVAAMTGAQLRELVARGRDPSFALEKPAHSRGTRRGLVHVSGAEVRDGEILVDPDRRYRVAGTDWELDSLGGYVDPDWGIAVEYDVPTIVRDAIEDDLRGTQAREQQ